MEEHEFIQGFQNDTGKKIYRYRKNCYSIEIKLK